ncbi:MAG TPA: 3-deoxy-D-manno-octulosonic acid transferase, partial [Burkholderiaceae bacterium]|nr:3-deoxy-D-manno-octulosonic acid transferase [Burkholderiaceae bacterium]
AALSLAAGASLRAADMDEGVALALTLLAEPDRRAALSANALRFASQHRGAAQRMARRIAALF